MNYMDELDEIIKKAERDISGSPEGRLRIASRKKSMEYYWKKEEGDRKGTYLRKSDREIARKLAQKDYAIKVLALANKQKSLTAKYNDLNMWKRIQDIYENYSQGRRAMVEPYVLSEIQYVKFWTKEKIKAFQWDSTTFTKEYELDEEVALSTEKGELVRSKSEKILADKLSLMGVPYVYEMPLYLKTQKKYMHPDFVVLNKRTRKEYYWEHFGMMDNVEYCEKMMKKIGAYQREGIFQGKQLIVTFETQNYPITTKCIEEIIKAYLK